MADALVSLVLLGEANWPENATPHTLREFAMAAQIEQRARRLKLGLIELTLEDLEEINDIRKALDLGIPQAAVDMLCSFCRRCYTCKGMEIEAVKRYTAPLFDEIPRRQWKPMRSAQARPATCCSFPISPWLLEQPKCFLRWWRQVVLCKRTST